MNVEVIVDRHQAIVEGVLIRRPPTLSPSQWLKFWETRSEYTAEYEHGYRTGYNAAIRNKRGGRP